uniref:Uncharacterized protein n=1 Tax=Arundo donax TaxID=35708 RepID=A0A0A8ZAT4_ARUDO
MGGASLRFDPRILHKSTSPPVFLLSPNLFLSFLSGSLLPHRLLLRSMPW